MDDGPGMALFRRRIKHPVEGTAQVVAVGAPPPAGSARATCELRLLVQAMGVPPTTVEHRERDAPADRWPAAGQTLPVVVDARRPDRLEVLWDRVPAAAPREQGPADAVATVLGGLTGAIAGDAAALVTGATHRVITINGQPADAGQIQDVERMTGMDLDGDGTVAGGAAPPGTPSLSSLVQGALSAAGAAASGPAPDPGADRLARLERLAALHASGALTDEEFEREKQRLLGG